MTNEEVRAHNSDILWFIKELDVRKTVYKDSCFNRETCSCQSYVEFVSTIQETFRRFYLLEKISGSDIE